MPTKRFNNLAPERKKKLFETALNEFAHNGYEGASLNTIIRETGISKGSLYYYFEDKADLYMTVLKFYMDDMIQKTGGMLTGEYTDDFWGDVENYAKKSLQILRENPDLVPFFKGLNVLSPTSESVKELYDHGKSIFTRIFKRGREIGAVRTDIPLDLLINLIFAVDQVLDFWFLEKWDGLDQTEMEEMITFYVGIFRSIADVKFDKGAAS